MTVNCTPFLAFLRPPRRVAIDVDCSLQRVVKFVNYGNFRLNECLLSMLLRTTTKYVVKLPVSRFAVGRCLESTAVVSPTLSKKKVSKKKYNELPAVYTNLDGTAAAPLGDWPGSISPLDMPSNDKIPGKFCKKSSKS